ncbi:MAG: OB-fold-containig protein [Allosphingosinicella sp.]|uniref:OB-fold-containig protein n=1 Tax=Allosphingosinicella sp. TaxID=2823234 RepID=UPI0039480122
MLDFLLAPENLPFAAALVLMLLIGLVEAVGLGAGGAADIDAEMPDLLGWLGVGRVPLLMLIVVLLALFGLLGLGLQQLAEALLGAPLSPWLAAPVAFLASLPLLGMCARGLERILPRDETTAVGLESLVGKRATVTIGTAARGHPARASVRDSHGQIHHVMVEPNDDLGRVQAGETVLLVRREGGIFIGLAEGDALIPRLDDRPAITG